MWAHRTAGAADSLMLSRNQICHHAPAVDVLAVHMLNRCQRRAQVCSKGQQTPLIWTCSWTSSSLHAKFFLSIGQSSRGHGWMLRRGSDAHMELRRRIQKSFE